MKKVFEKREEVRDQLLSVPVSKREKEMIFSAARRRGLTMSAHTRLVLVEDAEKTN